MNRVAIIMAAVVCTAFIASHMRAVGAEDDCLVNTYAVKRVPVIGLVCFWEPAQ